MYFVGKSLLALGQLLVLRLPNIIVLMMLTRLQGADDAGLFSLAITYLILLTAWWSGLDEMVIRETARNSRGASGQEANSARTTILTYGAARMGVSATLCAVVLGILWVSGAYEAGALAFIAVLLLSSIGDGFTDAVQAGLYGRERFNYAFALSSTQATLRIILAWAALTLSHSSLAVAWAWTLGSLGGALAALAALIALFPRVPVMAPGSASAVPLARWVREGWAFLAIGILITLEYQQDIIVLSALQPLSEVGYYSVATTLFASVGLPIRALRVALFPRMAQAAMDAVDTAGDAVQRLLYAFSVRWTLAIGLLCAFLGIVYAEPLVVLLFGPSMLAAVDSVRILMAAILVFALNVPQSQFLLATGRQNRTALLVAATVLVNLLANLLLGRAYGAEGAALARGISTTLYLILAIWSIYRFVDPPAWRAWLAPLAALAVAAGLAALLASWPWWLAAALAAMAYFAALLGGGAATGDWQALIGAAFSTPRNAR